MVWYSVFDFGKTPVGGAMLVDSTKVYSIFGYEADLEASHRWGIAALSESDGTVEEDSSNPIVLSLINGTEISRNSTRKFYQQGLIFNDDESLLYSCLIYKASDVHDEVAISEHSTTNLAV